MLIFLAFLVEFHAKIIYNNSVGLRKQLRGNRAMLLFSERYFSYDNKREVFSVLCGDTRCFAHFESDFFAA